MRPSASPMRRFGPAVLLLTCCHAWGIEAPRTPPASADSPAPAKASVTATDEGAFFEKLQRVAQFQALRPLVVPEAVLSELARGKADAAVAVLSGAADRGDRDANIALVRLQHWCNAMVSSRPADPQALIEKLSSELPAERAARVAGVIFAEADFRNRARAGCHDARFDYGAIEARLRESAQSGHAASATELAQFVRDPAEREALLQTAISSGYAPAMHAKAGKLVAAVQRGQTTQNVGSIRELLKQAGRSIPRAKVDLANCMALGCDGHPADALTAYAFGMDAARDGEPTAFFSMVRMPWGSRLSRTQMLAWQYFGQRLNELGCLGDGYIASAITLSKAIALLEKDQPPKVLETARADAEKLWRDYGARAQNENGCAAGPDASDGASRTN